MATVPSGIDISDQLTSIILPNLIIYAWSVGEGGVFATSLQGVSTNTNFPLLYTFQDFLIVIIFTANSSKFNRSILTYNFNGGVNMASHPNAALVEGLVIGYTNVFNSLVL